MIPFDPNVSTPAAPSAADKAAQENAQLLRIIRRDILTGLTTREMQVPHANMSEIDDADFRVFKRSFAKDLLRKYFPQPKAEPRTSNPIANTSNPIANINKEKTKAAPEFVSPVTLAESISQIEIWKKDIEKAQADVGNALRDSRLDERNNEGSVVEQLAKVSTTLGDMVGALNQSHKALVRTSIAAHMESGQINKEKERPINARRECESALVALDSVHADLGRLMVSNYELWQHTPPDDKTSVGKVADDLKKSVLLSMDQSMEGIYMCIVDEMAHMRLTQRKAGATHGK